MPEWIEFNIKNSTAKHEYKIEGNTIIIRAVVDVPNLEKPEDYTNFRKRMNAK